MTTLREASSEIDRRFDVAVRWVQNKSIRFPIRPTGRQSLFFYGRYKQATVGDNTSPQPSIFTPIRKYMWTAHTKNKGKSAQQAKAEYVAEVEKLCETFDYSTLASSPQLELAAIKFFEEFFGTPNHPFVETIKKFRAYPEYVASSPRSVTAAVEAAIAISPELQSSGSPSTISLPASPIRNKSNAPSAATSPVRQAIQKPTMNGVNDSSSASQPSANGHGSTSNSRINSPSSSSSPSHAPSSSLSPSRSTASSRAAALAAEVQLTKDVLAAKLAALQSSNAAKLAELEQQMANLNGTRAATSGKPIPLSQFATPITGRTRTALHTPVPSSSAAKSSTGFISLDPSSPFAATWTPTGLESRTQPMAPPPTPFTPFQTYQHHGHANGSVTLSSPLALPNKRSIEQEFNQHATANSSTIPASSSNVSSPIRPSAVATSSSSSFSRPTSPRSPLPYSPAGSSSSSSASSVTLGPVDVDVLLADLDSKHRAQVADFQLAEQHWKSQLEEAELRAEELAKRIQLAQHNQPVEEKEPTIQLTLNFEPGSIAQKAVSAAKVMLPVGVAAFAAYKAWRTYERLRR